MAHCDCGLILLLFLHMKGRINPEYCLIINLQEAAALKAIEWHLVKSDVAAPSAKGPARPRAQVRVLQRWHFSSELKRMATAGEVDRNGTKELWVFAKVYSSRPLPPPHFFFAFAFARICSILFFCFFMCLVYCVVRCA